MGGFAVGDVVRCERDAPAKGTWKNYVGRVGRVVNPDNDGEVGITWLVKPNRGVDSIDSWFLPSELVLVDGRAREGTRKPVSAPPGGQMVLGCPESQTGVQP